MKVASFLGLHFWPFEGLVQRLKKSFYLPYIPQLWRKPELSPQLWDRIWQWPGNEATSRLQLQIKQRATTRVVVIEFWHHFWDYNYLSPNRQYCNWTCNWYFTIPCKQLHAFCSAFLQITSVVVKWNYNYKLLCLKTCSYYAVITFGFSITTTLATTEILYKIL